MAKTKHRYAATRPDNARLVMLRELVPDRCNFKDHTFEKYVSEFMDSHMPGFPLGLLQTEGEGAYERWEIQPDERYKVITVQSRLYTCSNCSETLQNSEYEALTDKHVCENCYVDGAEPLDFDSEVKSYFVIVDTDYGDTAYVEDAGNDSLEIGDEKVEGWECDSWDESDAQDKADELNQEAASEGGYGFPWAHTWCHLPDDLIEDSELKAAGFKVATYTGGSGGRGDDTFRVCGVDGGGFSFKGSIFASLVDIVCGARNWPVKTDSGEAYLVDEDELLPMERLALTHEDKDNVTSP